MVGSFTSLAVNTSSADVCIISLLIFCQYLVLSRYSGKVGGGGVLLCFQDTITLHYCYYNTFSSLWRPGTLHYCYYNTFSSLWRPGSSLCLVVRYNDGNTLFVKKLKVLFFRDIPLDILHNRNLGEIKTLLQLVLKEADEGQLKKLSAFISEETHPSLKPESFLKYTNSFQGKDFKHFASWHMVLN